MFFNVTRFIFGNPPSPRLAEQWQICCQNWRECQRWFLNVPSHDIPQPFPQLDRAFTKRIDLGKKKHNGPISHRGKLQLAPLIRARGRAWFAVICGAIFNNWRCTCRLWAQTGSTNCGKTGVLLPEAIAGCDGTDVSCMSVWKLTCPLEMNHFKRNKILFQPIFWGQCNISNSQALIKHLRTKCL